MISTLEIDKLYERHFFILECCIGYFNFDDGWLPIIKDLLEAIEIIHKKKNIEQTNILKVEKKYGILYIEYSGGNSNISNLVRFAERLSYTSCEKCGRKGFLHSTTGTGLGDLYTMCDKHALEHLLRKI